MRKTIVVLLALSGCASPINQARLDNLRASCERGIQASCDAMPRQQWINEQEAQRNGLLAVGAVLLGVAAGLDIAASHGGGWHHHHW